MRTRFVLVPLWIAAAVACVLYLPTLRNAQLSPLGELVPKHAPAYRAEHESNRLFAFPLLARLIAVHRDPEMIPIPQVRRLGAFVAHLRDGDVDGAGDIRGGFPLVNVVHAPPLTREAGTTALLYLFASGDDGVISETEAADTVAKQAFPPDGRSFTGVTGAGPARAEQGKVIQDSLPWVELATLALVVLIVGLHFRAPGAGLFDLAVIAIGFLCARGALAWIAQRLSLSIPHEVEPVIVVLMFGVLTDYTIFFLSRFRSKLETGLAPVAAAEQASAELAPIVLTAGLTVAGASAALAAAELGFFQAFGPAMTLTMLVALAVALTFVPPALALARSALFWPSTDAGRPGEREQTKRRRLRGGVARAATSHPVLAGALAIALLAGAASGLSQLRLGNPLIAGLPAGSGPREAYAAATKGFAPGFVAPTVVVVEGKGVVHRRRALTRLERAISRQPGVAVTLGPREQLLGPPEGAVLSRTGDAARFLVILRRDPYGYRAMNDVSRLRGRLPALARAAGLTDARTRVAGDTALSRQTIEHTISDLKRIAPFACIAILLMLAVFLRAIVAPLFLLGASLLAVAASFGLATYFFQGLLGRDAITYLVPFAAAVLLVSLGSDYNVYIVGRIKHESAGRPLREAAMVASETASAPIAVAGIVLAMSFALLVIVPLQTFRELAFTMSVGLLLDAFVVRSLLVPALIVLVGLGRRGRRGGDAKQPEATVPGREGAALSRR